MNSEQFCYWLRGILDSLDENKPIGITHSNMIKKKLKKMQRSRSMIISAGYDYPVDRRDDDDETNNKVGYVQASN
jgi:hypothetical protein